MGSLADPVFTFLAAASALKYAIFYSWHDKVSQHAKLVGRVSELHIHPVKSCGTIELSEANCTFTGMESEGFIDRNWIITLRQEQGDRMVTARREPTIELIMPSFHGEYLHLDAPGMDTLKLPRISNVKGALVATTSVWGESIEGVDCGEDAAKWLRDFLKKPNEDFRLLHYNTALQKRNCANGLVGNYQFTAKDTDNVMYQDVAPFLLCSQKSLDDLNEKMYKNISMKNFRPNIVITGCGKPFEEDSWDDIWIGNAKFTKLFLCDRCTMTTIDPKTGEQDPKREPKATLEKYRLLVPKAGPMFGITLVTNKPSEIKIGDPVYATRQDEVIVGNTGIILDVSDK